MCGVLAYFHILGALGAGGYRDQNLGLAGAEDGSLPELTWAGARHIANVIQVGTPNAGSVKALDELVHGLKVDPTLPRGRHRAVVVQETTGPRVVDPCDPDVWTEMGWGLASTGTEEILEWLLPDIPDVAGRRRVALDHLRKSLRRAKQFAEAMDVPASPPAGTTLYLVAGDSKPTAALAEVEPGSGKWQLTETGPGDGTVLRTSALMDERASGDWSPRLVSPIDWSQVVFLFHDHLELTRSQEFTDNVLFILLDKPAHL